MQSNENKLRISAGLVAGIFVLIFFGVALYLRIALPYDRIFTEQWIKFVGVDSYYHMRIIESLSHTFPVLNSFDPYMLYPSGMGIGKFPFFDYLVAGIIRLVSSGAPDQHIIDSVGVYVPPLLGALTVIPVYFIGKTVFNRWAGVLAAGLIAILPGEFLGRTVLGFADHHAIEVLLTTTVIMFLVLAIRKAVQNELDFSKFKQKQWSAIITPIICSTLTGILLGIFFHTWTGAPLFGFIIFAFFIVQFIVDHIKGKTTDYLCITAVIVFLITFIMFLPSIENKRYMALLLLALLGSGVMGILSWLLRYRGMSNFYYPLALVLCAVAGLGVLYAIDAELLNSLFKMFGKVTRSGVRLTVMEGQPLLFPSGEFSLSVAWANFTTGLFFSFVSLVVIVYSLAKNNQPDKMLLFVWCLVILIITLSMRRFAYYYAVNVALLTGYAAWLMLSLVGFRERLGEVAEKAEQLKKKVKRKKRVAGLYKVKNLHMNAAGLIVVILLVFYPNIGPMPKVGSFPAGTKQAINTAKSIPYIPDDAWCEACDWLRESTPDPFGNPDYYYANYGSKSDYKRPDTVYSVAAWWDYGYWITGMGHRLPVCNPGSGGRDLTAKMFVAQSEEEANKLMDRLKTKYIMLDFDTATVKFYAVAGYAGIAENLFFDRYFKEEGNGMVRGDYYFHPEYYSSLAIRLYNFDGREYMPDDTIVISYEDKIFQGEPYKLIKSMQSFSNYTAAVKFVDSQVSGNYRIVGTDPFKSPIPLDAMKEYKLVYYSEGEKKHSGGSIAQVKIFEYSDIQ